MPLLWISLCFVAGLLAGSRLALPAASWFGVSGGVILLCLLLRRLPGGGTAPGGWMRWLNLAVRAGPRMKLPPLLLIAALSSGAGWWQASQPDLENGHIAAFNERGKALIEAVVVEPPEPGDRSTRLVVRSEQAALVDWEGRAGQPQPARGLVLAVLRGGAGYQYGDRLLLTGSPTVPPENEEFSYRDYLARQGIYTYLAYPAVEFVAREGGSPLRALLYRWRERAHQEINHLFPAPEAPLLAGILIGIESNLPDPLDQAFQATGTAHIIAISGFNIAILSELIFRLFRCVFRRWWAASTAILAIGLYTLLVGAGPPVVRAAIMGSLSLIAAQIGRRSTAVNSLAFSAAVMCLFNPHLPWDASFQLSFGATLGLTLYGDSLQRWLSVLLARKLPSELARRLAAPIGEYGLMTLAAQLTTLPFILLHFGRLSLSSLVANPLILPVQPLVMVFSGLAVLAGLASDPLGHLLAGLALPASTYTIRVVETLADLPGGVLAFGEVDGGTFALLCAAALSPALGIRFPVVRRLILQPAWLLSGTLLAAVFVLRGAATAPDGELHLTVYNEQGYAAILTRAPSGETMLIGAGPSGKRLNEILGRALPPFAGQLDAVLFNDPQAGSMSGILGVLDRFPPGRMIWGCQTPDHSTGRRIRSAARNSQAEIYRLNTGDRLAIGSEIRLHVLAHTDDGSALLVEWNSFRALLPGGIAPGELPAAQTAGLTLIVLDERDLEDTAVSDWQSLAPLAVFTALVEPVDENVVNWFNASANGWLAAHTNGHQIRLEQE